MGQSSSTRWLKVVASLGIVALFSSPVVFAGQSNGALRTSGPGQMNCGAKIECMTPDGHAGHVSRLSAPDPGATALIMEDDTVTCLLQEGETDFVIELPRFVSLDRFTFLNENATARGELRISVSNHRLPPNSAEWNDVEGVIPFAHKRLFGVSLLGIEAKYVRLSFRVEKQQQAAVAAAPTTKEKGSQAARSANRFETSAFEAALNSKFAGAYSRETPVLLSCISASVAPLSSSPAD